MRRQGRTEGASAHLLPGCPRQQGLPARPGHGDCGPDASHQVLACGRRAGVGQVPGQQGAQFLKSGKTITHRTKTLPDGTPMSNPPTPQEQIINNALFAGTPDQVYRQIEEFWHSVGGFGQLLVQMGGTMSHDEICDSLTLFANEVQPRLDRLTRTQQSAAA